ncbi:hypothetical protein HZA73_01185 [candidate division TA06 bacterium]|nr:hypothetical protein [candidate division TA06 bacterium]
MKRLVRFLIIISFCFLAASCTKRKPEEIEYAPNAPNSPYPPDSATNIDHTTIDVTLSWKCSDKDGGLLYYDVYLDTLNPPSALAASGLATASYFADSLGYNTTYYWKVFAKDDKGIITAGSVWSFTTLPHSNLAPYVPVYLNPADGAPWEYPTLLFNWTCADHTEDDTLYYTFYLGNTAELPALNQPYFQQNYLEKTGLAYDTKYYWRVIVRDNHWAFTEGPVQSFTTRTCPWISKRDLPSPRYGFGTAVINNKIYIIGGTNGLTWLNEVLEYDPLSDTWTRKADMPTPRSNLAVAVWDNRIYAIGGRINDVVYNRNEMYDPVLNTWASLDTMPIAYEAANNITSAQAVQGKIYTLGPVLQYNISTNDWWTDTVIFADTIAPDTIYADTFYNYIKSYLPNDNRCHCSAVYNNLIYVMGGNNGPKPLPSVDVYNPGTNLWTSARDMIGPANYSAATVANGFIYVLGGYDGTYSNRVRKYDPGTDTWFIRSDMQTGRSCLGAAFINNRIYAIGGANVFPLATVEEYHLDLDPKR